MKSIFDVIVIGLGAMGSAAAFHLARADRRVLGIDRFHPPHPHGSSHGQTRIIREAYFEHPAYVPLIQRAYSLWADLEIRSGRKLLQVTGGLMTGAADSIVVAGARRSAELHGLPHEVLSAAEISRRFPALQPGKNMIGIWESRAGILFPEECVAAHLQAAKNAGATLALNETVLRWESDGAKVSVKTERNVFVAANLVIAAGPWAPSLIPELKAALTVERQVQFWFNPLQNRRHFQPENCPIHLWEYEPGRFFYGFPDLGSGVKVARHHEGEVANPDSVRREVGEEETNVMRDLVRRFLPDANGPVKQAVACLYTNTADGHFLLDVHPEHPNVMIASPCSGHGFKFSSVIGEVIRQKVCGETCPFDLGLFGAWRNWNSVAHKRKNFPA